MLVSPLLAAFANDLGVEGIGTNFSPVIIPLSLTLTGGLAANLLLGMVRGRLKNSPATTATTQTHQATPDQNVLRSFCPEVAFNLKPPTKNSAHIESHAEFLPPPRGWGHCSSDCQDCCSFSLPRTDGKEQAEKLAGNNGNDANSSGRLRIRMGFAHSLRKPRSTRKHRSKIQSL